LNSPCLLFVIPSPFSAAGCPCRACGGGQTQPAEVGASAARQCPGRGHFVAPGGKGSSVRLWGRQGSFPLLVTPVCFGHTDASQHFSARNSAQFAER